MLGIVRLELRLGLGLGLEFGKTFGVRIRIEIKTEFSRKGLRLCSCADRRGRSRLRQQMSGANGFKYIVTVLFTPNIERMLDYMQ